MPPLVDRLAARALGLPRPRPYRVHPVRIAMRDGVELLADHYEPVGPSAGVLMARGPYGRGTAMSLLTARPYAWHGYQVLFVSSRGTGGSGGEFDPMRTEVPDGQDVVAWLRQRSWFPGTFATIGGSYLGHTQWALLTDPPAELAAAVISVGPHDFARHAWGAGTFNLDLIGWSDSIVRPSGVLRGITAQRRLRPVLETRPLADAVLRYFDGLAPWMRDRLERSDLADPYWSPMRHADALDQVDIPVLLVSGWHDLFVRQSLEQYRHLCERGVVVALTVGPWTHISPGASRIGVPESLDWLDHHLAGGPSRRRTAVRVFVTGADEWRDLTTWPPASETGRLYLHPHQLAPEKPTVDSPMSTFRYDPADATPTVGGPIIAHGGSVDDTSLAARVDVLAFDSAPLPADREVLGTVTVHLAHRSEHPDADLFVRLSEVDVRGRSRNVTEGYRRLDPSRGQQPVVLALTDTAHRFRRGHRIRLLVAGGSFPQYARSLGTGANPVTGAEFVTNDHTVLHSEGASWVELPESRTS